MPTTTDKNEFSDQDASQVLRGADGSPLGETAAPPRSSHKRSGSGLRGQLPDELIDELLAGARSEDEIVGPGGVLAGLTKRLVERAMEVELTDHLGYEHGESPPGGTGNTRNGSTPKTLQTEHGPVEIDTPRDRNGSFEPRIVRKRQRRFEGFDDKIIALYSRGLSTRDIQAYLQDLYGVEVGRDLISRVTDAVMDDARAWASRPLDDVYPIVFLDCLVLKIREGGSVQRKACYLALGVNMEGEREVLGMWFQETEGAKFWMQVLSELKQRGVQDILICCVDGLKGFPEAIEAIFPRTIVQTCIVHLIRHSLKYVPRRQYDQVVKDLRPIYTAIDADAAVSGARGVRREMGRQARRDHPGLAQRLGTCHAVHGVPARSAPRHLHHQRDRSPQPAAAQSDQDQGALPQRGRRPQADLPGRHQRRAAMDQDEKLDARPAGVQNPLRRPATRLKPSNPPTQLVGHPLGELPPVRPVARPETSRRRSMSSRPVVCWSDSVARRRLREGC
jgi:putative transposase